MISHQGQSITGTLGYLGDFPTLSHFVLVVCRATASPLCGNTPTLPSKTPSPLTFCLGADLPRLGDQQHAPDPRPHFHREIPSAALQPASISPIPNQRASLRDTCPRTDRHVTLRTIPVKVFKVNLFLFFLLSFCSVTISSKLDDGSPGLCVVSVGFSPPSDSDKPLRRRRLDLRYATRSRDVTWAGRSCCYPHAGLP